MSVHTFVMRVKAVHAHYHALTESSPADLQALGSKHQQVAAAVMSLGVLISDQLKNMSAEMRGRITGAITWEIAQTAAEIIFTAGAATLATKGAKFARIADKLNDFAKTYDALDNPAIRNVLARIANISSESGELRKILEKFDEKTVVVERAVKVVNETLQNACFTPDTLVLTEDGKLPIGEVRQGQKVMAFDFDSGQWCYREVKARMDNQYGGIVVSITVGDGAIEATGDHPFWVVLGDDLQDRPMPKPLSPGEDENRTLTGRWISAKHLMPGDQLVDRNGHAQLVNTIALRHESSIQVCNLSVEENHSFCVGGVGLLVHNVDAWCKILTDKHKSWQTIRENLAKKFNRDIGRIHGTTSFTIRFLNNGISQPQNEVMESLSKTSASMN
tara:strand:+ start:142190 stop:143356 length:1167 start_codon:yes stop_codon:yes gene_type:complete